MKKIIYRILRQMLSLLKFTTRIYHFFFNSRIVVLSKGAISESILQEMQNDSNFNNIYDDLIAFTGFSPEEIVPYILRHSRNNFKSEFNWFNPSNDREIIHFYRASSAFLFANSIHPYVTKLDIIKEGKVLDYGAGAGCNTLGLAKRKLQVDYIEINALQSDFIKFRSERAGLYVNEISPYFNGAFDPIKCIQGNYDAIVLMDVLEHIPYYHILLAHLIECLNPLGLIIENTPFSTSEEEHALHLPPSIPMEEAMIGMELIEDNVWRKKP